MWAWGKHGNDKLETSRILQAAMAGASDVEILRAAADQLLSSGRLDRAGVWIDSRELLLLSRDPKLPMSITATQQGFRGVVVDASGDPTPAEWSHLSPRDALSDELLSSGKTIEHDENGAGPRPMIGPLLEMRRALWVPVQLDERLRAVLFGAARSSNAVLPREKLELAATELGIALSLAQQRYRARESQSDLRMVRKILAGLQSPSSVDRVLVDLLDDLTDINGSGLGIAFAVIGEVQAVGGKPPSSAEATGERPVGAIEFLWRSGSPNWVGAVESEPVAAIWRQALATARAAGSEADSSWSHGEVARIVAIPLLSRGEILGVLVAGLPSEAASVGTLERMELRAGLAVLAILWRRQQGDLARQRISQQALLDCGAEALVLLGKQGEIGAMSQRAQKMIEKGDEADSEPKRTPRYFVELFRAREHRRVDDWIRRLASREWGDTQQTVSSPAELVSGEPVRLRGSLVGDEIIAAVLEPQPVAQLAQPDRAKAELHNLVEWLEEGVILFDERGSIRVMNARFAQIAGLDPEDCTQLKTIGELIARISGQTSDPKAFAARWMEIHRGMDNHTREEMQLMRPVPRVLERAARPILDARGHRLGHLEIYRDVTAQRVFHSKLLQTEKLAALGQLITGVAHELSNPLTSVLGYAQRLLLREDAVGRSEEARQIMQEAERASGILRQLLATARDTRQERRRVALNQVIARATELQKFSLAAEKVRMELDLDPTLPFIKGDAGQLQQVVMNLVGNARQAIEQQGNGGIIRVLTKSLDGQRALLAVQDNGPGIPESILSRIFDPFFTTKPPGVGTGLGLAIVRGIVREHGGTVTVSTPPEGGVTFSLEFPAAALDESNTPVRTQAHGSRIVSRPVAAAPSLREWRGAHALVVEDEPTVARLIADVLEEEGLKVEVHTQAQPALARAAAEAFDLLICDMKLPGLSGRYVFESLAKARNPLTERLLFVTGDVLATATRDFLERHALPHLAKPFRVEELVEQARRVLAKAGERKSATAIARTNATGK